MSFCSFSCGRCIVYPSSIYGFWLPLWWHLQTFHTLYAISYFIEFAYCMHLSPSHFTVQLFGNASLSTRGGDYITQVFTVARQKWCYHSKGDVLLQWPIHPCLFCAKLLRLLVRLIQILGTCMSEKNN